MSDNKKFDINKLIKLSDEVFTHNHLENLQSYNDEMTISQVVRFFEKHDIEFTKTMIQNYVRVNVMPPPIDKRYYTKDHLIMLALISNLKNIYSLDDIKLLFKPILQDVSTFDDDLIKMPLIYELANEAYKNSVEDWKDEIPKLIDNITNLVKDSVIKKDKEDSVTFFVTILTLMIQSIATKEYVKLLIDEYNNMNTQ